MTARCTTAPARGRPSPCSPRGPRAPAEPAAATDPGFGAGGGWCQDRAMTPDETCQAVAGAVGDLAAHFMLSPDTYAAAMGNGFEGMDFYVAGRGAALGAVAGPVVAAAFVFFNPDAIVPAWERTESLASRSEAALLWTAAC